MQQKLKYPTTLTRERIDTKLAILVLLQLSLGPPRTTSFILFGDVVVNFFFLFLLKASYNVSRGTLEKNVRGGEKSTGRGHSTREEYWYPIGVSHLVAPTTEASCP